MSANSEIENQVIFLQEEVARLRAEVSLLGADDGNNMFMFPAGDVFPMGVPSGGDGSDIKIFTVTSGDAESGYYGHADGDEGNTKLFVPEIALGSALPSGSRVLGHPITLTITGGSEE